jgi:hypothetical protein
MSTSTSTFVNNSNLIAKYIYAMISRCTAGRRRPRGFHK